MHKTPWSDGTSSLSVGLLGLMERLVAIIPQPRTHQFLHSGVLPKNAYVRWISIETQEKKYREERSASIAKRYSRSIEEYERDRDGKGYREKRDIRVDNCLGTIAVAKFWCPGVVVYTFWWNDAIRMRRLAQIGLDGYF